MIDEAISQVCYFLLLQYKFSNLLCESQSSESLDGDVEFDCPKCNLTFEDNHSFMKHFKAEHACKKHKQH